MESRRGTRRRLVTSRRAVSRNYTPALPAAGRYVTGTGGVDTQSTRSVRSLSRIILVEEISIMRAKVFIWPAAVLGFAVAISAGAGVTWAQYGGQAAAPPPAAPTQSAPPAKESGKAPKVNKAEEAAYKK